MVIVDPGPDDDEHIAKLAELGTIPLVLISHKHDDHTGGIDKIVERTGCGRTRRRQRVPAWPRRPADRR